MVSQNRQLLQFGDTIHFLSLWLQLKNATKHLFDSTGAEDRNRTGTGG